MNHRRIQFVLFASCMAVYWITNYGGVRSPDSEIVFRTAQSLLNQGSFAVAQGLSTWPGFGTAKGKSGEYYSIHPPMQAVLLVPFVGLAEIVNRTGWYENARLPVSHYVDESRVLEIVDGKIKQTWSSPGTHKNEHALRYLASWFNPLVTSLSVLVFFKLLLHLTGSSSGALGSSILFAFGTLAWPYSGTYFSEPLACLFLILAVYSATFIDTDGMKNERSAFLSGLFLSFAIATHLLEMLFLPFFAFYVSYIAYRRRALRIVVHWMLGGAPAVLGLALFNWFRFGNPFQFGHDVSQFNTIHFFSPVSPLFWRAFYGLLFGPGKGLLLFCPAVILGLFCWPALHRRNPRLSKLLMAATLTRTSFLFFYVYWHGAFCLGPRHLLSEIFLFIIPCGFWLSEKFQKSEVKSITVFIFATWICMLEQIYFCIGEIFSYYHMTKFIYAKEGLDVFAGDYLYLSWHVSPMFRLLQYRRGPFLLQTLPVSNTTLWLVGALISCFAAVLVVFAVRRQMAPRAAKLVAL